MVRLSRFATPDGLAPKGSDGCGLECVMVKNIARISGTFDGQSFTDSTVRVPRRALLQLSQIYRDHYGEEACQNALEFLSGYFYCHNRDEPLFLIQPWTFMTTPAGWVSLVDGCHGESYDGMRGVIASDQFRGISMAYRLYGPCRIAIRAGAPLMRVLPVPRHMLKATFDLFSV